MASRLERPRFFPGHYLNSADLEALLAYARDVSREHALAAHAWGIAIGLELVEVPAADGGSPVDLFVMPGFAWDGYGRAIVVLSPTQVPLARFSGLPSGNQAVWLRYDETPFRGLREGFETCGATEAFARVRESFAIEVGPFSQIRDRQGGVSVAGTTIEDARLFGLALSDEAPLMCDASLPHQVYPADTARWLVPIGVANWQSGLPGSLQPRSVDALKLGRTLRAMCGAVAENLFAADGVIRLRDRFTQFKPGDVADTICAADAITVDDLINAPDRDDPTKTTNRLIGKELVWVEGNMRATGQVRLFGTRLELRDASGAETNNVALFARRAVSPNNIAAGQDFQIVIGSASDGKDRFTIGTAPATPTGFGDLTERFIVRSDGVLAAGLSIPNDQKSDHVLFTRPDALTMALATNAGATAKIAFQTLPALAETAHVAFDDGTKKLRVGVGTDLSRFTTWTSDGNIGVRTDAPTDAHIDADDLVIHEEGDVGLTLLGDAGSLCSIHFADGVASVAEQRAGFVRYNHQNNRMQFGTVDAVRATIDSQGDLGLGTDTPNARIDIRESGSGRSLELNANSIQAEDGGAATRIDLQPNGGGARFNGATSSGNRAVITGDGRLGVGTDTPTTAAHITRSDPDLRLDVSGGGAEARVSFAVAGTVRSSVTYDVGSSATWLMNAGFRTATLRDDKMGVNLGTDLPQTNLHVRGSLTQDASSLNSHVALIENMGGSNADVLALRVAGAAVDESNNFITFFDQTGAIGRIESGHQDANAVSNPSQSGSFLRLISGGADFAERLPRADASAPIGAGKIVGVKHGRVSLSTVDADSVLVTSDRAVVVGNAGVDDASDSETVALIGQVVLLANGPVRAGDFLVPSGNNDGLGRAVAPGALAPSDAGRVAGRAWGDKPGDATGPVLVAVGVQGADALAALSATVAAQQLAIDRLSRLIESLRSDRSD